MSCLYSHAFFCSTEYQSECETLQEEHDVEDDVVSCETVVEEKCEDETSGYTTNTKCSKWPREVCSVQRTPVKKFTPETRCQKVPVELCGPSGKCVVRNQPLITATLRMRSPSWSSRVSNGAADDPW